MKSRVVRFRNGRDAVVLKVFSIRTLQDVHAGSSEWLRTSNDRVREGHLQCLICQFSACDRVIGGPKSILAIFL